MEKLQSKSVRDGQRVQFSIKVTGKPAPEVTWYREGMQIHNSPDFVISKEGNLHTLTIPEAFHEDSGKFTVKAVSQSGETQCSAELFVEGSSDKGKDYVPTDLLLDLSFYICVNIHEFCFTSSKRCT